MPKRNQNKSLLELYEQADCIIRAAEEWDKTYKKDDDSFKDLVRSESRLVRKLRVYFRELAKDRVPGMVNWLEYRERVIKAYDVVVDIGDIQFEKEANLLFNIVFEEVELAASAGLRAAEAVTKIELGVDKFDKAIQDVTRKQVGKLVDQVTSTTRDEIKGSILTSLQLGESTDQAVDRLLETIDNPMRAERIARTESVRAYQNGMLEFGRRSNAVTKTWQTVQIGACPLCTPLDGITISVDEDFDIGESAPPGHPNCRCGLVLNYSEKSE